MRRSARLASAALLASALAPFVGTAAAEADELKPAVDTAAWFWADQQSLANGTSGTPMQLSGVPAGDFGIAYTGGKATRDPGTPDDPTDDDTVATSNKETLLAFDLSGVEEGSTVDRFTVTVAVDPAGRNLALPVIAVPGQTPKGGTPPIIACLNLEGFGEAEGGPYDQKPPSDCTDAAFGEHDAATNTYTFDLTLFAQDWVDGKDNFGVALRPIEDATADPFNLVLKPLPSIVTALTFLPPEPEIDVEEPFVPPAPVDQGTGFTPAAPVAEPVQQPTPQLNPQPKPVAVAPVPRTVRRAAVPLIETSEPTTSFWFALVAGVVILGATSLVLGDPVVGDERRRARRAVTRAPRAVATGGAGRPRQALRPRSL